MDQVHRLAHRLSLMYNQSFPVVPVSERQRTREYVYGIRKWVSMPGQNRMWCKSQLDCRELWLASRIMGVLCAIPGLSGCEHGFTVTAFSVIRSVLRECGDK